MGINFCSLFFALSKGFYSGVILLHFCSHPKFPFLCFQCTSLPFFIFLTGVLLTLNLLQWYFPAEPPGAKKISGEGWESVVIGWEQRHKVATLWATGAEEVIKPWGSHFLKLPKKMGEWPESLKVFHDSGSFLAISLDISEAFAYHCQTI